MLFSAMSWLHMGHRSDIQRKNWQVSALLRGDGHLWNTHLAAFLFSRFLFLLSALGSLLLSSL